MSIPLEALPPDRRARAQAALERHGLDREAPSYDPSEQWLQDRFVARARALFYARLMFLLLGSLILAVPSWSFYFGIGGPWAIGVYAAMLLYGIANYLVIQHRTAGRIVTYVTLCLDLLVSVILILLPMEGGGLESPLLGTQLLFTTLFAILFPKPIAILPPLLALPLTTRLDLLLDGMVSPIEILAVFWYSGLNIIVVYVVIYLDQQESSAQREVLELQTDLRELAIVEERNRLARDIHDGLGASLSSLIIQSEYLLQLAPKGALRDEASELKTTAEEAIDELRRSLQMMREDFELVPALQDYATTYCERIQLPLVFEAQGHAPHVAPDQGLALFRVLQEALTNIARHSEASRVRVAISFSDSTVALEVRDDGKGFDPAKQPVGHFGVPNMRERALKAGGLLDVESAPGEGTRLVVTLPLVVPG